MATVQRDVQLNASPSDAMAVVSDASRWPDWYPGLTGVDIVAPFPQTGGSVAFQVKSAGVSNTLTETVLAYEPDRLLLFQMKGMLSGQARWELTPDGDGTRLTTTFDYDLPGGMLGKLLDALIIKRLNGRSLQAALGNLQSLV